MSEKERYEAPEGGVAYVLREGDRSYPLQILMLHGWGGDERVMWVLESVLPDEAPAAALRALYSIEGEGYQWTNKQASIKTEMDDLSAAISAVKRNLETLVMEHGFERRKLVLMGFSQGAALSFALAEALETPPRAVVALAGYYPRGEPSRISEIPIYWGHGIRDDLVPIERARQDVVHLEEQGADVNFCETDVGHKLGIECTRGLKSWLRDLAR